MSNHFILQLKDELSGFFSFFSLYICQQGNVMLLDCVNLDILSAENQKAVNAVHRCSVEKQKGTIAIDFVQR